MTYIILIIFRAPQIIMKKYKEQHQLQEKEIMHLEGILQIEKSEMIWGFTLIFDETGDAWKLYDWGQ